MAVAVAAALCGCGRKDLTELDVYYTADVQGFYWSRPEPRWDNREAGGYAIFKKFLQSREGKYLLFDGGTTGVPSYFSLAYLLSHVPQ